MNQCHVENTHLGLLHHVFLVEDQRLEGYKGEVTEGVKFANDVPDAQPIDCDPHLGQSKSNPKSFRLFINRQSLEKAGYIPLPGEAYEYVSWSEYQSALK